MSAYTDNREHEKLVLEFLGWSDVRFNMRGASGIPPDGYGFNRDGSKRRRIALRYSGHPLALLRELGERLGLKVYLETEPSTHKDSEVDHPVWCAVCPEADGMYVDENWCYGNTPGEAVFEFAWRIAPDIARAMSEDDE